MDEESIIPVEITLSEAKALYALISTLPAGDMRSEFAGIMRKLEASLYGVLSLEEMSELSSMTKDGA